MTIHQNICPKCGGPTEEGLCANCRVEKTEWLICDPRVSVTFCPTCESLKQGSIWTDVTRGHEELASELSLGAVKLHEDVSDPNFEIEIRDLTPNRTLSTIYVTAHLYGLTVEGLCKVEIIWIKEQCDRCNRYSGGYYEAIVQVRASGRTPDVFERERASAIAKSFEDELQEDGERLSFISDEKETKDGVDIIVSSHHMGELISHKITKEFGGRVTTHPKLVGEKAGKPLYRVTYLVRLPCYRKGDVVFFDRKYYEVRGADKGGFWLFDLTDGTSSFIQQEGGRLIGNIRDAENAMVAYLDGDVAGLLDPETYKNIELQVPKWLEFTSGEEVRILRDRQNERIILIG